ncbi:uncharacterized protein Z519_01037 [Cladophialophora bantiana CBS 173.52]|uniref:Uncharacterized protein n=1 Tax=Cladophialophora bantiana (strain ATCC 10958 / CBS 173.52 / CDC B-1940 / NIH 8579) TaxID=1442370 RepID=A0A0D2HVQ6_CLAB1|nr:uncharacterized protein Z519_01037 [Cladophialophora bantiana CBS 173.52]KIW97453.1 hypothetical protein Z519_01037 [Cladophialophora bantiana CBS 173.52]
MNAHVNDDNDGNDDDVFDTLDEPSDHSPDEASDSDDSDAGAGVGAAGRSNNAASSIRTDDHHPRAQLLEDLQGQLRSLTLEAETILSRQPRSTQLALAAETKSLFGEYKQYGSMARLKAGLEKFLRSGNEKGRICFEEEKEEGEDGMTKDGQQSQFQPPFPSHTKRRPAHYGEAFMLNDTADDDKPKFDEEVDFPSTTRARDASSSRDDLEDTAPQHKSFHQFRTVDPDSVPYVTTLPWDPIATKISWANHARWPKGLLGNLNKIFSIADAEARERLFHHVSKYGPAPIFRVGLAQSLKSEFGTIFEPAQNHYLGLTPETRAFLRGVYTRGGVGGGDGGGGGHKHLNLAERRILASTCRVAEDSVQMFWEDMAEALKSYEAMRIFMAAREVERNDEDKRVQMEKRRAEVMRAHVERFNREFRSGASAITSFANATANPIPNPNLNPNAGASSEGAKDTRTVPSSRR